MKLFTSVDQIPDHCRPSVVSIGNYDGVHLGHQNVINTLMRHANSLDVPASIITFEPLARELFAPQSVARLGSVKQRADYLFELGIAQVLCVDFNHEFANLSPTEFIENILIDGFGVKHLCVGDDFRFGRDRAGDFELLAKAGAEKGFAVSAHDTFEIDGERVSSGRVRAALESDDFCLAEQLLGRPYSISGTVSKGQQLGRTLDFPTANIVLGDYRNAINGVFSVNVVLEDGQNFKGVANVGRRPTVGGNENRLEVHIFEFNQDIYGRDISVVFCQKIREEKKFSSLSALRRQIEDDAQKARDFFGI